MMETRPHAVGEYLRQLDRSLRDLPADRRKEIVGEIEDHIEGLLAEFGPQPSAADVRNMLERVGDPDVIAAEARNGLGIAPAKARWTDVAAVVLLPIPFLGWIVGCVLLWISDVWNTRDKLIGTLAGPGLFVLGALVLVAGSSRGAAEVGVGPSGPSTDVGGSALGPIELLVLACVFVVPLVAAIYLGWKLQRARGR